MAEMTLKNARELCTKAELEFYQQSRGRELTSQDAATLQKNRVRARELRDKWRDQSTRQRRALQQSKGTRVVAKTDRSTQKAQLFQEMLKRFEARIATVRESDQQAKAGKPVKRKTSATRAAKHREERAEVRKGLKEKKKRITAALAKPIEAENPLAKATSNVDENSTTATPSRTTKRTSPSAGEDTPNKGLQVNDVQQIKVQGKANQQRQKISGLTNRVRGHVSARGKRAQAARDQGKKP